MIALKITTVQASNTVPVTRALAAYLQERLATPVEYVGGVPWQERYRLLDEGEIHLAWICGWPYVRRADRPDTSVELLVAPVMKAKRYQDRPIYYSDVVVRHDSPFNTFLDLRGASWAYNEPGSQSGYLLTLYHLASLGETSGFFGRVIESGAHQRSLRQVLAGKVDASAIDTTLLEWELLRHPEMRSQLRTIGTLGPNPIPPLVASKRLDPQLAWRLRQLLCEMHGTGAGRSVLDLGLLRRFETVTDTDYDAIRHMARLAAPTF
jgi:phosphonate transport system substrate-binding protein